jgi:hypothetical protein
MRRSVCCILSICAFLKGALFAQTVSLTSSNLPIVVVRTNGQTIVDEPKVTVDLGIIHRGDGARNLLTDPFNVYGGKAGIEIRGQSSQTFPMKSYTIELRTASGTAQDVPLLGMPADNDWVLYAPYTDKTLMRNVLAYAIAREMGRWAARCRFVELVVDNDYKGVYVLMEKIKKSTARVNIATLAATDLAGEPLTGGYIFSLDKQPNGWFSSFVPPNSTSRNTRQFSYVYPQPEDIAQPQKDYIRRYVDSFENALFGPQFQDPDKGVRRYADIPSFIDYLIVNEVSRNVDGYRLSTYLHKDRDSRDRRIRAGPVWDYDLAFRNANYCNGSDITGWAYRFNYVCPGDGAGLIPFWWDRLLMDTAFNSLLYCRWTDLRKGTLSMSRLRSLVDSVGTVLQEAQQRHFMRWRILGQYVWPNPTPIPASYPAELEQLKSWLEYRLNWIDLAIAPSGACAGWPPNLPGATEVSVFPNPFRGAGQLTIRSKARQRLELTAVDATGRLVAQRGVTVPKGLSSQSLGAAAWPSGMYYLRIVDEDGRSFAYRVFKL